MSRALRLAVLVLSLPACERTVDLGGDRDGSAADGGAEIDAPRRDAGLSAEAHVPCGSDADCTPPRVCRSDDGATAVCRLPCASAADCADGLCVRPARVDTEAFCALTCDPVDVGDGNGCPAGEACDVLGRNRPGGEYVPVWGCRRIEAPVAPGDPCSTSSPSRCPSGTSCQHVATSPFCLEFCDRSVLGCGAGGSCDPFPSPSDGRLIGICQPGFP